MWFELIELSEINIYMVVFNLQVAKTMHLLVLFTDGFFVFH